MIQNPVTKEHNLIRLMEDEGKRGAMMRKVTVLLATVFFIALASVAYSQSLADIANKEKERRAEVKNDIVITNEQAAKFQSEPATVNSGDRPRADSDSEDTASRLRDLARKRGESDEPVDFQGRNESYWRKTMEEARQRVKDLQNEANAISLRIASLQNQFYAEDDGFKRETIGRDIQKGFFEQDKNKEELAKAQDIVQDLDKEAHKSGALPGWYKEKAQ
jgi:hypothetical protein